MASGAPAAEDTGDGQPDGLLLTVEEAAKRLRLGRTFVYRLISSGELESVTGAAAASPRRMPHRVRSHAAQGA